MRKLNIFKYFLWKQTALKRKSRSLSYGSIHKTWLRAAPATQYRNSQTNEWRCSKYRTLIYRINRFREIFRLREEIREKCATSESKITLTAIFFLNKQKNSLRMKNIWAGLKFHVQVLVDVDFADKDGKFCPLLA